MLWSKLPLAKVTLARLEVLEKAPPPMVVTEAGMAMLVKPDDRNALIPMLWSRLPLAKLTLARLEVLKKALLPTLVTEAGMAMLVKPDD